MKCFYESQNTCFFPLWCHSWFQEHGLYLKFKLNYCFQHKIGYTYMNYTKFQSYRIPSCAIICKMRWGWLETWQWNTKLKARRSRWCRWPPAQRRHLSSSTHENIPQHYVPQPPIASSSRVQLNNLPVHPTAPFQLAIPSGYLNTFSFDSNYHHSGY